MKIFHLADLHIGKNISGFSMLEEQAHILRQILRYIEAEQPDVLLISGDIYDKPVPSTAAVELFDSFITELSQVSFEVNSAKWKESEFTNKSSSENNLNTQASNSTVDHTSSESYLSADLTHNSENNLNTKQNTVCASNKPIAKRKLVTLIISGNHDSPERLSFASNILKNRQIHICGVFDGTLHKVTVSDAFGSVDFHLLPFIRPANVRKHYPDEVTDSYQDAIETILRHNPIDSKHRNVLLAHQFVTSSGTDSIRSDSEIEPIGGQTNIDADLFKFFDYVALGHLHGAQKVGRDTVRYAGSPLKYSFSEVFHKKSIAMLNLGEKNKLGSCFVDYELLPLTPLHEMRKIRGPLAELLSDEVIAAANSHDYLHVTLTDDELMIDAIGRLRSVYPNIMELEFDNARSHAETISSISLPTLGAEELFTDFFKELNGQLPSETQMQILTKILGHV